MNRNTLGPIPLTLMLVGIVWLGSAYEPIEPVMLLLLLTILVGLVLNAYPTFKANLYTAFTPATPTTDSGSTNPYPNIYHQSAGGG